MKWFLLLLLGLWPALYCLGLVPPSNRAHFTSILNSLFRYYRHYKTSAALNPRHFPPLPSPPPPYRPSAFPCPCYSSFSLFLFLSPMALIPFPIRHHSLFFFHIYLLSCFAFFIIFYSHLLFFLLVFYSLSRIIFLFFTHGYLSIFSELSTLSPFIPLRPLPIF